MKFILKTQCTNEFYDGHEYALVEITPYDASVIMRQKQIFESAHEQAKDLMGLLFYSAEARYFTRHADEFDELFEQFDFPPGDQPCFIQAPDKFVVSDEHVERSDGDRLFVGEDDIYWLCRVGECQIETANLPYSEVARAAIEVQEVQKA